MNRKRFPLGDILTAMFPIAVALLWIFADDVNADPAVLVVFSGLAVILIISWVAARRRRRQLAKKQRSVEKLRSQSGQVGEDDDTDLKDKYYF
jgi:membrane protein implicated in regulation of membrane protease activity